MIRTALIAIVAILLFGLASAAHADGFPMVGNAGLIVAKTMNKLSDQTDEWFHQGAYLRSVQAYRMRIAYDPHDLDAYSLGAWLLWSSGRLDEALQMYEDAARANPNDYEPYFDAGMNASERGDEIQAGLWFTHACLHGAPAEGWKMLSHTYRRLGLIDAAISVMQHAKTLDPSDPTIDLNLKWLRETKQGKPVS